MKLKLTYYPIEPGEDVVFIANDWHTALLPCYLKSMYKSKGIYPSAKVSRYILALKQKHQFSAVPINAVNYNWILLWYLYRLLIAFTTLPTKADLALRTSRFLIFLMSSGAHLTLQMGMTCNHPLIDYCI